jgi:hypothetical protein
MEWVNLSGKMEENMKDNGLKVNNMELVFIGILKVLKKEVNGRMVKEPIG